MVICNTQVRGFCPINVALGTSDHVYYPLTRASSAKSSNKEAAGYGLVVDIERHAGRRVPMVTIRSPLQVSNSGTIKVSVVYNIVICVDKVS